MRFLPALSICVAALLCLAQPSDARADDNPGLQDIVIGVGTLQGLPDADADANGNDNAQRPQPEDTGRTRDGFGRVARALYAAFGQDGADVKRYPFPRSVHSVTTGAVDVHMPLIHAPNMDAQPLAYDFVGEPVSQVAFVLYTHADDPPPDIENLDGLHIGTMRGHAAFFPFEVRELSSVSSGVKMVENGRLDGFILDQDSVDRYLRRNRVKVIRRTLYGEWNDCMIIAKGRDDLDRALSEALREIKKDPEMAAMMKNIHSDYTDWQPYEMGW